VSTKAARPPKRLPAQVVFGMALRKRRNELDISQEQLAHDAGMSRSYVTDVELGKRNVTVANMEALADAVNTPLWMLLRP
jgi:transcriptional regulator with XRE-family HTH domain